MKLRSVSDELKLLGFELGHSFERCDRAIRDTGGSCWIWMLLSLRVLRRLGQLFSFNQFSATHKKNEKKL